MINTKEIKNNLKAKFVGKRILYYETVDSTNLEAFRLIDDSKAKHGDIIIARTQFSGRGQQDHKWASPEGGLYLSIVSASKATPDSNLITFVSAVACIDAIESVTGKKAGLKWVNDIIINGQKLGGILTETITRGKISTHVSGIGINVNSKITNNDSKYPPVTLSELTGKDININLLTAELCNFFEQYFTVYQNDSTAIISKWLEYSNITGLEINFSLNNKSYTGLIEGINNQGHLVVKAGKEKFTLTSTKNTEILYPSFSATNL